MDKEKKATQGQSAVCFDGFSIDTNAIHIVLDMLSPYLEYDPEEEYRILSYESISEKNEVLYEQIFIPFITEFRKLSTISHERGIPDSWFGYQTSYSIIHAVNMKAWWLLHYFAIKESIETHCKNVAAEQIDKIAQKATCHFIDGDGSIEETVHYYITEALKQSKETEQVISQELLEKAEYYQAQPSHPVTFR